MTAQVLLAILAGIEERFGVFGPVVAAYVAKIIRDLTTITYTEEQTASFVQNELAALAHRADDVQRANQ